VEDFDVFELLSELIKIEVLDTKDFEYNTKTNHLGYTVDEWVSATNNLTKHYDEYPYNLINSYSWKDVDDLGNYYACTKELSGVAQYFSMNVNITSIPFSFRSGMCMPVQCTQEMLDDVANRLNDVFDSLMAFLSRFEELWIIKKYNIRFGYSFTAPKDGLNSIRQGKIIPAIIIGIFLFGM
jgi:hypothetical protein